MPLDKTTALKADIDAFLVIFDKAIRHEAARSDISLKNSACKSLTKAIRDYKNKYIDPNEAVGAAARDRLRLPHWDTIRTPKPAPDNAHERGISFPGPRRAHIRVRRSGSRTWSGNPNAAEAVIFTNPLFPSKLHFSFEFQEKDRGKTLYFAICWQGGGGNKGPWSNLEKAVISGFFMGISFSYRSAGDGDIISHFPADSRQALPRCPLPAWQAGHFSKRRERCGG